MNGRTSSKESRICSNIRWSLQNESIYTDLQILGDVENAGDIKGVVFVEFIKCIFEILGTNLPDTHEDELVVWVASEKHGEQFACILGSNFCPFLFLNNDQFTSRQHKT